MTLAEPVAAARPYLDQFDYDHYPENFRRFEADAGPLFDALREETDAALATDLIGDLSAAWDALPRHARKDAAFRDKQVLSLFLSPAARRHSEEAAAFCETLRALWCAKYPRNAYLAGDYEQILKGFDANLLGLPLRKSKKR